MNEAEKIERLKTIINKARSENRFVSLDFIKKTTNELRHMTLGRSKKLEWSVKDVQSESAEARKWTLNQRGILVVEELTKDHTFQWRSVPLANVTRIKSDGVETVFDD